jgi:hypothetical protein
MAGWVINLPPKEKTGSFNGATTFGRTTLGIMTLRIIKHSAMTSKKNETQLTKT